MIRKLVIIIIFILLFSITNNAEINSNDKININPADMISSSATLFIEIVSIPQALNILQKYNNFIPKNNLLNDYVEIIQMFKEKIGTNIYNIEIWKQLGIRTDQSLFIINTRQFGEKDNQ